MFSKIQNDLQDDHLKNATLLHEILLNQMVVKLILKDFLNPAHLVKLQVMNLKN